MDREALERAQQQMRGRVSGNSATSESTGSKCKHGIYKPAGESVALYCPLCNYGFGLRASEPEKPPKKKRARKNSGLPGVSPDNVQMASSIGD